MTTALWVALAGILIGPGVAVALSRVADRRKQSDGEQTQNIALARLEEKVDAIPDKMNGQIAKALTEHAKLWHVDRSTTNPGIPRFTGEILE